MFQWTSVLGGTALVASGGFLVNYGWNRLTSQSAARDKMLRTLAAELAHNAVILRSQQYCEPDGANLGRVIVYPRVRAEGLKAAIASNLFTGPKDCELFYRMLDLNTIIDDFCHTLAVVESLVTASPEERGAWNRGIRDGIAIKELTACTVELRQLL